MKDEGIHLLLFSARESAQESLGLSPFEILTKEKLSKSDILRDLDFKLSHLSSMQRQDLTHLLQAFKYLIPDVPKPDRSYRMCADNRKMNSVSESDTFSLPRMDDCIENVKNARFITKFDLFKRFWQVFLTERDYESSASLEPDELYHKNKGIT